MSKNYKTPGVYIEEISALPKTISEVATSVPAFIGYTEKADRNGQSLLNQPTRINSLNEYRVLFGEAFFPRFSLNPVPSNTSDPDTRNDLSLKATGGKAGIKVELDTERVLKYLPDTVFYLYYGLNLFYANGGGPCYIVSVGTYGDESSKRIRKEELLKGLDSLEDVDEPSMVIIPDAVGLSSQADCYEIYRRMLAHCAKLQDRIAILDIYDGFLPRSGGNSGQDVITAFREHTGLECLKYGAAYYPWLETNMVQENSLTYKNIDDAFDMKGLLPEVEAVQLLDKFPSDEEEFSSAFIKEHPHLAEDPQKVASLLPEYLETAGSKLHLSLRAVSPSYENLVEALRFLENLHPPSCALAGVYARVDEQRGVWKAPANVSLTGVVKPNVEISHEEQEALIVDAANGKSINAIRLFVGKGTLVWGARTLAGNNQEWRYINVRRFFNMVEESIKKATESFVFEPNDANTWASVRLMIENYLTQKWKEGALAGAKPNEAFYVQVGLGKTMTALEVLEGRMIVEIGMALLRPAEFIILKFSHKMQES